MQTSETLEGLAKELNIPMNQFFFLGAIIPSSRSQNLNYGNEDLSSQQVNRFLNEFLPLFHRIAKTERQLFVLTARNMVYRKPPLPKWTLADANGKPA